MRWATPLLLVAACGGEVIWVQTPWDPADHVVIVRTTPEGDPLDPTPRIHPSDRAFTATIDRRQRLFALVFDAQTESSTGIPFASCELRFVSADEGLTPTSVLATVELDAETSAVAFEPANALPFGVQYIGQCAASVDPCADVELTVTELPTPNGAISGGVMISDDVGYVTILVGNGFHLARYTSSGEVQHFAPLEGLRRTASSLAFDGLDTIYGVARTDTSTNILFAADLDGARKATVDIDELQDVQVGADGSIFMKRRDVELIELVDGDTLVPMSGHPTPIRELGVAGRDRMMIYTRLAVHVRDRTSNWIEEYRPDTAEVAFELRAHAVDEDVMMIGGEFEVVRVRDRPTRQWNKVAEPFGLKNRVFSAAPMKAGRFVVGGELAQTAFWTGSDFCVFDHEGALNITNISPGPSGRTALATGTGQQDGLVLWLTVPPPGD